MPYRVEVALPRDASKTEKGKVLESLLSDVLSAMQYSVAGDVRVTGAEIDVLARHDVSGEVVNIECKARRDPLSSEVLNKALGILYARDYSATWVVTTGSFGKDARGFLTEWERQPEEKRRRLLAYDGNRLAELLIRTRRVCDPNGLIVSSSDYPNPELFLLYTNRAVYWVLLTIDSETRIADRAYAYRADSGIPVTDADEIQALERLDSSLSGYRWMQPGPISRYGDKNTALEQEAENVVTVLAGDHWADYRPSRPQDFVGRSELISDVFRFLDSVAQNQTATRLLAIKGPSGWGKSSVILKLASLARSKRRKRRYFIYAVDSRAAMSRRFAQLALGKCLRAAANSGFVPQRFASVPIGSTSDLLEDPELSDLCTHLKQNGKSILLFFDQFEQILGKQQLADLFSEIQALASSIDGGQENIALAFSWKTDGTIPQDHPAYHMWHNLADRRQEFALTPFSSSEVSKALHVFSKELGEELLPQYRRILTDQCQGYPWLLKKLCIHIRNMRLSGFDQAEILGKSLNIQNLFDQDIQELSPAEGDCIERIAGDSPANYFELENIYGPDTITALVDRRLVIRSGSQLSLYWDIFRDYVATRKPPYIPISYIPQSEVGVYVKLLSWLIQEKIVGYKDIAARLNIKVSSLENLLRDAVMIGNASADRKNETVYSSNTTQDEAFEQVVSFWRNHVLFQHVTNELVSGGYAYEDMPDLLKELYSGAEYSEQTRRFYARRVLSWLRAVGLVDVVGGTIEVSSRTPSWQNFFAITGRRRLSSASGVFTCAAPPVRVVELIERLITEPVNMKALERDGYRNAYYVLRDLDSVQVKDNYVELQESIEGLSIAVWLAQKAKNTPTLRLVESVGRQRSAYEIGVAVSEHFGLRWSEGSLLRNGSAMRQWARWCEGILGKDESVNIQ